jgi:thiamine-phosphate pyrophosphorylase
MNRDNPGAPRLILFSPPLPAESAAMLVEAACRATDVASIILRTSGLEENEILSRAKFLLPVAQKTGAALLLTDRADLVAKANADGAHLSDFPAQAALVASLKPKFIAGASGLVSRHDAMTAGETGADYVMFGEPHGGERETPEFVLDRVTWWAEIFQIPCVAFTTSVDEIPALVRAGADFIALDEAVWRSDAPIETLGQIAPHLRLKRTG